MVIKGIMSIELDFVNVNTERENIKVNVSLQHTVIKSTTSTAEHSGPHPSHKPHEDSSQINSDTVKHSQTHISSRREEIIFIAIHTRQSFTDRC